jgi:hypothetical protein
MTPDEITVEEGDLVTFRIKSDHSLELHVHGYDLAKARLDRANRQSFHSTPRSPVASRSKTTTAIACWACSSCGHVSTS